MSRNRKRILVAAALALTAPHLMGCDALRSPLAIRFRDGFSTGLGDGLASALSATEPVSSLLGQLASSFFRGLESVLTPIQTQGSTGSNR